MNEKVKLVLRTVDVSQNLNKPGFCAAAIQRAQHMKYSHF
jgi:hypothetical protein